MSNAHPILIRNAWEPDPSTRSFTPTNPSTGDPIPGAYPISNRATLQQLAIAGAGAAESLNHTDPETIARFLETHAQLIDNRRDSIADMAHTETGLSRSPRLVEIEMDRTIDQIRQGASCVRDRSWVNARIDTHHNLRSMFEPLGGAVLTIGPNNFPLAYNAIAGGDFVAAIAARNPVIAKAHPLHPGTSRLLAQCAHDASIECGLPVGSIQMFYNCEPEDGLALIRMREISAVGFTGSRSAGLALKQAADETGTPIYLELSSINPMFLLPHAVQVHTKTIAGIIADSMLSASGQQCTCPGLIVLDDSNASDALIECVQDRLTNTQPQVMLSRAGVEHLHDSVSKIIDQGARVLIGAQPIDGSSARYAHTLLQANANAFLDRPDAFQSEMFGVAALIVRCTHPNQFTQIARVLEGNLTGTIHAEPQDEPIRESLARVLRTRVGRLIHNGVPTGVHVNPATVHGGPFPSTGHPGFTAVGLPTSIHRFAALRCYDRVEQSHLPIELRDENPTRSMLRCINGLPTHSDADQC